MPKRNIPIARTVMDENEAKAASRVIASGWVTQGPEVAKFEEEFAAIVDASHACAVSSCTAALHLALLVAGVQPGDEVITVSHSFIAAANAIRHCGATPVFVDIEAATFNMDPNRIAEAITERTRAILCVDQIGMPCDIAAIRAVAEEKGLVVIEDAACAVGSEICVDGAWVKAGGPAPDIACFSFHPRKVLTTGEGGVITTNNAEWDKSLRLLRHQGMSVDDRARHSADQVIFEEYPVIGYNYRMTDIQAAVGREQLKRLSGIVADRRQIAARYHEQLSNIEGLVVPHEPEWARSNWQSYCVRLPEPCIQIKVMQYMLDRGIATRRGVMCAHREKAYGANPPRHDLSESERAQDQCILIPLYSQLAEDDQDYVVETLKAACDSRDCRIG